MKLFSSIPWALGIRSLLPFLELSNRSYKAAVPGHKIDFIGYIINLYSEITGLYSWESHNFIAER